MEFSHRIQPLYANFFFTGTLPDGGGYLIILNMNFYVTPNIQMIECIINPSGGTTMAKNPFGTQQQLQNRKVIAIETFSNQDVLNSPITPSNPVIPASVFQGAFLTMYTAAINASQGHPKQAEGLYFDQLPFSMFRRMYNANTNSSQATSGGAELFRIRPTEMSWTKCYVSIPTPVALQQTCSALLLIHYLDIDDPGTAYM